MKEYLENRIEEVKNEYRWAKFSARDILTGQLYELEHALEHLNKLDETIK